MAHFDGVHVESVVTVLGTGLTPSARLVLAPVLSGLARVEWGG